MYCFSLLVNSILLKQLVHRVGLIKVVFCSTLHSESMVAAYNIIVHEINFINDSSQQLHEDDEQSPASPEAIDKDNVISSTTQPFGAYFTQKMEGIQISDSGKSANLYYKPQFLKPLWSTGYHLLLFGQHFC